ncbi:4-(cytidine 5'-diphospho)-2-C-methyl-D-erythritol kinase [Alteromonas sediminis]|uniref:4-diphosphocytidyl-2-C-methyl-D-erythritol kinase n=1 Tax=Alteromonas sediminis TaxID=2259342 RepID=A0A3N5Z8I6_9ALTE|nr:4-(cytidine 5'-diphospho)-2-C-methyl-D-erythritol kinase [Alteromonas sediminis]RPJ67174.1 4-(cytidine 5'-diphospho)-2-C-methyl-D-erythritol kinase [Alteromonas sediminis]
MAVTWWASPAKLNLFLHITGRYEDGYHALQTVFQMLDYGDEIGVETSDTGEISLAQSISGVADHENLVYRAAKLLQTETRTTEGAKLHIHKRLPMGGGVGGGSSNAATTLCALNSMWRTALNQSELIELGQQLGADVPVFIHGRTTFAEGTGDKFTDITTPDTVFLVAHPNVHVSTQAIFTAADLPRKTPVISSQHYSFNATQNDCQEIVCKRHPEVAKLLQWLLQFAPSRMTGTGACVFSVFSDRISAEKTLKQLPSQWSGFIAQGVHTSPLLKQLKQYSI